METWRVLHGDCMRLMPQLPAGIADCIITDPPYGIDYQSAWRTDKAKWKPRIANDASPFVWFLPEAARLLVDGGGLLCFCRWDVAEAFCLAIGWAGLKVRGQIVWDRMAHGAADPQVSPGPQHDLIWYATKGRRTFHGKRPKSVVRAMRIHGTALAHPNEKPAELMASLIESYSRPGGLVIDPFAGSGATGRACVEAGRRFLGIELAEEYCSLSIRRLAATWPRACAV